MTTMNWAELAAECSRLEKRTRELEAEVQAFKQQHTGDLMLIRMLQNDRARFRKIADAARAYVDQPGMSCYVSANARQAERDGLCARLVESLQEEND